MLLASLLCGLFARTFFGALTPLGDNAAMLMGLIFKTVYELLLILMYVHGGPKKLCKMVQFFGPPCIL